MRGRHYGGRLRPYFDESDAGGTSNNPIPETTAEVKDTAGDATNAVKHLATALESLMPHLQRLVEEGVKLHPIEAAKEVPAAAQEAAGNVGEAAGSVVEGGTHAAQAVPAVATDTLETAQTATEEAGSAASNAASSARRGFKLKRRRG